MSIICQSSHAVAIYTGQEIFIEVANQAMLNIWNKPVDIIGKTLSEAFLEMTDQTVVTTAQRVWQTGSNSTIEAICTDLVIDGELQHYYFDHEYKAVRDENDQVFAITHTAINVTERVKSKEEAVHQASLFRELVEQAPVAITVLHGEQLTIDIVNPKMLEIWGKSKDVIGMTLAEAMPELDEQPFIEILTNVLRSGKSYYGRESLAHIERGGKIVDGYFNFDCQPLWRGDGQIIGVLQVAVDVTDQVMARREIQQTKTMMDLAITAAHLGTCQIDSATGDFVYNEVMPRIYGYQDEVPMTFEMVMKQVSEEFREVIDHEIEIATVNRSHFDFIYSLRRFDNNEVIWLRTFGKIAESPDHVQSFSCFVMDITESKKDEQRKNDFIGMVSHELKTPLTSLNSYVQLLSRHADKHDNSFIKKIAGSTVTQLSKMTAMINGFLNLSRFESGKITLDSTVFNMVELINEIINEHQETNDMQPISFNYPTGFFMKADRIKIGIVLSNLLSNAIKYSPHGNVITINCRQIENQIEISVVDTGIGISKDDLEKVFDRFFRVHSEFVSGFGIGLYLSAEIIHRHGGKIWAQSDLGKGSTFYFSLPMLE